MNRSAGVTPVFDLRTTKAGGTPALHPSVLGFKARLVLRGILSLRERVRVSGNGTSSSHGLLTHLLTSGKHKSEI